MHSDRYACVCGHINRNEFMNDFSRLPIGKVGFVTFALLKLSGVISSSWWYILIFCLLD